MQVILNKKVTEKYRYFMDRGLSKRDYLWLKMYAFL